jgi:hypothetical protein
VALSQSWDYNPTLQHTTFDQQDKINWLDSIRKCGALVAKSELLANRIYLKVKREKESNGERGTREV